VRTLFTVQSECGFIKPWKYDNINKWHMVKQIGMASFAC
jgi:hypothetical protein